MVRRVGNTVLTGKCEMNFSVFFLVVLVVWWFDSILRDWWRRMGIVLVGVRFPGALYLYMRRQGPAASRGTCSHFTRAHEADAG